MQSLRHRWGSWPAWRRPNIASKHVSSGARARRVWPIMRYAIGLAGSSIKRFRSWPRGSWCGRRSGGKKWTPAITLPQMRQGIAVILREAFQCSTMSQMLAERQKRLRRHELARFYHWKQRKRLAPLNIHKRQFEVSGGDSRSRILLMEQQVWSLQRARRSTLRPRVAADNQPCDFVSQHRLKAKASG